MYFRDADIAIIVFDVTNKQTMECVDYWSREAYNANTGDFLVVLVGNKNDLTSKR
jgi:GTPase SAR1 family protein